MTDDLVERLRNTGEGEMYLAPYTTKVLIDTAADCIEELKETIGPLKLTVRSLKSDIESMNNNTRRLVAALRRISELPSDRADEAAIIAKFVLGDRI